MRIANEQRKNERNPNPGFAMDLKNKSETLNTEHFFIDNENEKGKKEEETGAGGE